MAVFEFIEDWYNNRRQTPGLDSGLDSMSPVNYGKSAQAMGCASQRESGPHERMISWTALIEQRGWTV